MFIETIEITAVLQTVLKKTLKMACVRTFMNRFDLYGDRYYCTPHSDTSLLDLDLNSRSQDCKKRRTSAPNISQSFQSIDMEFSVLLRLAGVMKLILILSPPFNIQGREPY